MGSYTEKLVGELREAAAFLYNCSEDHWAGWLDKSADMIGNSDIEGISYLESAFGGMGSINDLLIHPVNGHSISGAEVDRVNDELKQRLTSALNLAQKIRANAEFE